MDPLNQPQEEEIDPNEDHGFGEDAVFEAEKALLEQVMQFAQQRMIEQVAARRGTPPEAPPAAPPEGGDEAPPAGDMEEIPGADTEAPAEGGGEAGAEDPDMEKLKALLGGR